MVPNQLKSPTGYRCPGSNHGVSRAVHLDRLSSCYPNCRQCQHRTETGTLSGRQVKRQKETQARGLKKPLFNPEGAAGVHLNDITPAIAKDLAAALGIHLRYERSSHSDPPVIAVSGDGRAITSEIVASVVEGLRWSGCNVVNIGSASAACLSFTVDHLQTDGGIAMGNPTQLPQMVGLKFWTRQNGPMSNDGSLKRVEELFKKGTDRPTRRFGSLRHIKIDSAYLNALSEHYHALRPLRIMLSSACHPIDDYLKRLFQTVSCEVIRCPATLKCLGKHVRGAKAHLGAQIEGDGETCKLYDEQGQLVSTDRLLLLLVRQVLGKDSEETIVLENEISASVNERLAASGIRIKRNAPSREAMYSTITDLSARFGGGPSGRFWYKIGDTVAPDALMTLTLLLKAASRSDRQLSQVLDSAGQLK